MARPTTARRSKPAARADFDEDAAICSIRLAWPRAARVTRHVRRRRRRGRAPRARARRRRRTSDVPGRRLALVRALPAAVRGPHARQPHPGAPPSRALAAPESTSGSTGRSRPTSASRCRRSAPTRRAWVTPTGVPYDDRWVHGVVPSAPQAPAGWHRHIGIAVSSRTAAAAVHGSQPPDPGHADRLDRHRHAPRLLRRMGPPPRAAAPARPRRGSHSAHVVDRQRSRDDQADPSDPAMRSATSRPSNRLSLASSRSHSTALRLENRRSATALSGS